MRWKTAIVCLFLVGLSILPRLYRIDNPVADWHSWRQADTAAVTRNFIKEGLTPLYPKFDSFFVLNETGQPNPNRYFFAEFPLYNLITYPLYRWFGAQEIYARLVSVFFSSLTAAMLYLLVRRFSSERVAVLSGLFFAILPFSIYYGRVILPDPLHLFLSVSALYLVTLWTEKEDWGWGIAAGLITSGALLTKPYALVLALPVGYLVWRRWGLGLLKRPATYGFLAIALAPFLAWRWHINQHPEGMFGTSWLFNQGNIRFTGAFFRWLIFERMNRLIFATGGFVLFWLGIIQGRKHTEGWFYFWWLVGIASYMVVIAKGNVTHDYYQIPLIPIGAIFMAKGFEFLSMYGKGLWSRLINFGLAIGFTAMMLAFGWYEIRGFFNINHPEIVEAGQAVDRLTPPDAKVIAPYQSDSAFLYQTNRYGWTVGEGLIPEFIKEGATHLISVNLDATTQEWMKRCSVIEQTETWVLIDLRRCRE
jgi:hypothetical protein